MGLTFHARLLHSLVAGCIQSVCLDEQRCPLIKKGILEYFLLLLEMSFCCLCVGHHSRVEWFACDKYEKVHAGANSEISIIVIIARLDKRNFEVILLSSHPNIECLLWSLNINSAF